LASVFDWVFLPPPPSLTSPRRILRFSHECRRLFTDIGRGGPNPGKAPSNNFPARYMNYRPQQPC
jgi:hypothetical protein